MSINRHVMELLLGFALATLVYTATASLAFAHHREGHGSGGGGDDDGAGGIYDVTVSGTLFSKDDKTFMGSGAPGRDKTVAVGRDFIDLVLSFFLDIDTFGFDQSSGEPRGKLCFNFGPGSIPGTGTIMAIRFERDATALVQYSFTGYADDEETHVKYALEMFGKFSGDPWRPVDGGTTRVTLDSWNMAINTGGVVKKIACLGGSSSDVIFFETFIDVTESSSQ